MDDSQQNPLSPPQWTIDRGERLISSSSDSSTDSFIEKLMEGRSAEIAKNLIDVEEGEISRLSPAPAPKIESDELPPIEDVPLFVDPSVIRLDRLGVVVSVVDGIVTIHSELLPNSLNQLHIRGRGAIKTDTVDEGTVVFDSAGASIGRVNDVIGPISWPYYAVKLCGGSDTRLDRGSEVYFVPENDDFTVYLLSKEIRTSRVNYVEAANAPELQLITRKGCDASWKDDQEMPVTKLDFSDDEAERQHKRSKKKKNIKKPRIGAGEEISSTTNDYYQPPLNPSYADQTRFGTRAPGVINMRPRFTGPGNYFEHSQPRFDFRNGGPRPFYDPRGRWR